MKTRLVLILITGLLIFVPTARAIGMSPIYREIYFEPGMEETFHFIMIGERDSDLLVRPYASGSLENYTTVPDQSYLIPAGMGIGFAATLNLPEKLKPGMHMLHVGILEELPSGGGGGQGIVAKLGVESLVGVRVPYPAKYLEMKMKCPEADVGESVLFEVDVFNRGTKDLEDVSGFIEIFSHDHSVVERVDMNEGSLYLAARDNAHFTANWDTTGVQPGLYDGIVTINYDGNETSSKCRFRLGELNIDILDFSANETQQGGIAKFVAILQSTWNSEIPQVFNRIDIRDKDGKLVGSTSGETIRVGSWSEKKMTVYWDTEENDVGEYNALLTLEYEGKNSTKTTRFNIVSTFEWLSNLIMNNWQLIMITVLVLLIIYQAIKSKKPRKVRKISKQRKNQGKGSNEA